MHKQMNALGRKMNGNIFELYFKFCIVNKKLKIKDRGKFLFLRTTAGLRDCGSTLFFVSICKYLMSRNCGRVF